MAKAMEVDLVTTEIKGKPINNDLYYEKAKDSKEGSDEVEDLFELLSKVKEKHPDI